MIIQEHLGTSRNIQEHLGTSGNIWEHLGTLGTLIRLDMNTQSYMWDWMDWMGSLKHSHTRAPLCGANNSGHLAFQQVPPRQRQHQQVAVYQLHITCPDRLSTSKTLQRAMTRHVVKMFFLAQLCRCRQMNKTGGTLFYLRRKDKTSFRRLLCQVSNAFTFGEIRHVTKEVGTVYVNTNFI